MMTVPLKEALSSVLKLDESKFVYGQMTDTACFYDWFYLVSFKGIWTEIINKTGAKRLFIFPQGPYNTKFIADDPALFEDPKSHAVYTAFINAVRKSGEDMPFYVIDCETFAIEKWEGGAHYA